MRRHDETEGRSRSVARFGALLTLTLAALVWLPVPARAGDRVTFRMNWYWRGIQAPFALALERRYFEQAGLDVELLEGRGSATTVQLVGTKADTFGFADGFTVMLNAARGVPVRAVATPINGSSFAIVVLEDAPVRAVRDLEGRRLGIPPATGTRRSGPPSWRRTDCAGTRSSSFRWTRGPRARRSPNAGWTQCWAAPPTCP